MKTRREPDTLDEWAALLAPNAGFKPDERAPGEKTLEEIAAEYGMSAKMAQETMLLRWKAGLVTRRLLKLKPGIKVLVYKPVKHAQK
jgi:hypothetical protein